MLKTELREIYLKKRKELSAEEVDILSNKIVENFILKFNPTEHQNIHCFLPIEKFNEIKTSYLIKYCWQRHIKVYIPKMVGEHLIAVEYDEHTVLEKNTWGILEPTTNEDSGRQDFDYVITPLLYCDKKGNRVGYGKGFYDRLFSQISPESKKVGVSYFPPAEEITDVYWADVPLDYLVTPDEVLSFGKTTLKSTK